MPYGEGFRGDPPQPSLLREGVIAIVNGYYSRFSNISSLPKQGGLGWVSVLGWVSYKVIYFVPQNIIKRMAKYHPLKNKLIYFVVALIIQVT